MVPVLPGGVAVTLGSQLLDGGVGVAAVLRVQQLLALTGPVSGQLKQQCYARAHSNSHVQV